MVGGGEPHDGGRARGEPLRGIGYNSYHAWGVVAARGEPLSASTGLFDLARSCAVLVRKEVQMESTRHQRCGIQQIVAVVA
jgi:hypothetical protein